MTARGHAIAGRRSGLHQPKAGVTQNKRAGVKNTRRREIDIRRLILLLLVAGAAAALSSTLAVVLATGAAASRATPPGPSGRIAFQRYLFQNKPLQADIFAANVNGSAPRRITNAPRGRSTTSPIGHRTATQSCSNAGRRSMDHGRSGRERPNSCGLDG